MSAQLATELEQVSPSPQKEFEEDRTNLFLMRRTLIQNLVTLVMVSDAHHIPIGIELNFKFESSSMWYIIVPNITFKGLFINDLRRHGNSAPKFIETCDTSKCTVALDTLFHAVVLK